MTDAIVFMNVCRLRKAVRALITTLLSTLMLALPAHAGELDEASQLFKAGDYSRALEKVNRFLETRPQDVQGRFLKGLILAGLNRPNEAIVVFRKLTEDYPELPEPYNNLAVVYAQQKQYDKARDALERAIRTHPAYATAYENLGDIYSYLASEAYGKALQIDAQNTSAQTKLAMINELFGTGKADVGKAALVRSSASSPNRPILLAANPQATATPQTASKPANEASPLSSHSASQLPERKPADASSQQESSIPVSATEPTTASSAEAEITAAIDGWLAAWSKKDFKEYLAHYAKDFQPPGSLSRKEWEAERARRVGKPGKIEVTRDKLIIRMEGADKAVAQFRQHYRSAGFKASSGKTLVLIRHEGKWLIQQERIGG